ncbi:Thioredoxin-like fold [Pseudocohnilembus persalinus]|uniref:Glutathione peroxidase n=1 Tax=Pseudocohnilembus persalinus TaxID=266149 RepID=A0A0V0R5M2_PSEPJ|nr:Thioredoxin-like fold [Pseudocohnilembus persalinus]|eukprot:KRX09771.1 Thioredoxin-like fold [Pseudocohnilembus persalinus]
MDQLYDKYGQKGLEIFAFPCNQFGAQEPNPNNEILDAARKKTNCKIQYPFFEKLEVNGKACHEVYQFLKNNSSLWNESKGKCEDIKWNFGKFLVDGQGYVKNYYEPGITPMEIEEDIKKLLKSVQ